MHFQNLREEEIIDFLQELGLLNQLPRLVDGGFSSSIIRIRSMIILFVNTNGKPNTNRKTKTNTNMNIDWSQPGAAGGANGGCEVHRQPSPDQRTQIRSQVLGAW